MSSGDKHECLFVSALHVLVSSPRGHAFYFHIFPCFTPCVRFSPHTAFHRLLLCAVRGIHLWTEYTYHFCSRIVPCARRTYWVVRRASFLLECWCLPYFSLTVGIQIYFLGLYPRYGLCLMCRIGTPISSCFFFWRRSENSISLQECAGCGLSGKPANCILQSSAVSKETIRE